MRTFLAKLFEEKSNLPEITFLLTQLLDVKISKTTIKTELEGDPNFPSLLSISDLLNRNGIENLSVKIDMTKLIDVPIPFVTQIAGTINKETNFFTIVKEITDLGIYFFDPEKYRWAFSNFDDFLTRCSGIVLLTEVVSYAGEKNYSRNIKSENRNIFIKKITAISLPAIVIVTGLITLMQIGKPAILPFLFYILTLSGVAMGILLLWYELNQDNPLLQQICSSGKRINCGAVLKSKASKIVGVSWSTIGLSYFMGNLLLLLICGITNTLALFVVSVFNLLAIPYVFYSIYYQWRIAKQWCLLCLIVQVLLLLQLLIIFIGKWHGIFPLSLITFQIIIKTVLAFSIPFVAVNFIFPILLKGREGESAKNQLRRLKHDPKIFEALLANEKKVVQNSEHLGIKLGNPNAEYKIIKVCSPYCAPCGRAHQMLENLLHDNPNLQVEIIFNVPNNQYDLRIKPVLHLLALDRPGDQTIIKKALDDWYSEQKDYDGFALRYCVNDELNNQGTRISLMDKWCQEAGISFTPTFFISMPGLAGKAEKFHQLPSIYDIDDLKYFLSADLY